jgi:hypothetical protein
VWREVDRHQKSCAIYGGGYALLLRKTGEPIIEIKDGNFYAAGRILIIEKYDFFAFISCFRCEAA